MSQTQRDGITTTVVPLQTSYDIVAVPQKCQNVDKKSETMECLDCLIMVLYYDVLLSLCDVLLSLYGVLL